MYCEHISSVIAERVIRLNRLVLNGNQMLMCQACFDDSVSEVKLRAALEDFIWTQTVSDAL